MDLTLAYRIIIYRKTMGERGGDSRVLVGSDPDTAMIDTGEKVRPPGDPPDGGASWVEKVVGKSEGGRPSPEKVINDEFVSQRLQLEFPDGEDGEPVITIGAEVLEAMNGLWKQCMVVKVLGRNVAISALSRKLRELWNPKGAMYVMDLPRQFFMIRFELEEEYLEALTGGPWRAFGSYLMVKAWSPEFDPLKHEIETTPVWVRLSNIPINFYHKAILMGIARGLGKPIKVDLTTLNFERARFARVCVEVNLARPLKGTVLINGERYFVAYEGLSNICSMCGLYGHLVHNCSRRVQEKEKEVVAPRSREQLSQSQGALSNDGFTVVGRQGRKAAPPANTMIFAAGGSSQDLGRNLLNIPITKDMGNISISNRFGGLIEEITDQNLREGIIAGRENKENDGVWMQTKKGKSSVQVKKGVGSGLLEKNKGVSKDGPKDKRAGGNKQGEASGLRVKNQLLNRPTRGLVYGPTGRELELSVSGKRQRMEMNFVGRPGGVFVSAETDEGLDRGIVYRNDEDGVSSPLGTTDQVQSNAMVLHSDSSTEVARVAVA